jgi:hypothetical protein
MATMLKLPQWSGLERLVPERVRRAPWLRPHYPLVGVELREDAVVVTRLRRQRGVYQLAGHARRELPDGTFATSMMLPSIAEPAQLARVISEALEGAGAEGAAKISVTLPDTAARVALLDFQEVPPSREQVSQLLRWRLKKTVPFSLDSARISWQELGRAEDGRVQMLVAVTPEDSLRQIEKVFEALGMRVGLVDLASFDLFNLLRLDGFWDQEEEGPEQAPRDRALLSATPSYFSLMITRGDRLIFYRAKNYHVRGGFRGEDSVAVFGRELRTTLGYYEEHLLGEGIETIHARIVGISPQSLLETARSIGGSEVRPVQIANLLPEVRQMSPEQALELMPSLGLALRREP